MWLIFYNQECKFSLMATRSCIVPYIGFFNKHICQWEVSKGSRLYCCTCDLFRAFFIYFLTKFPGIISYCVNSDKFHKSKQTLMPEHEHDIATNLHVESALKIGFVKGGPWLVRAPHSFVELIRGITG